MRYFVVLTILQAFTCCRLLIFTLIGCINTMTYYHIVQLSDPVNFKGKLIKSRCRAYMITYIIMSYLTFRNIFIFYGFFLRFYQKNFSTWTIIHNTTNQALTNIMLIKRIIIIVFILVHLEFFFFIYKKYFKYIVYLYIALIS